MGFIDGFINRITRKDDELEGAEDFYEYCPNCYANLTLQKGYNPSLKYWECKGCGQLLINPEIESDIVWVCDDCGAVMNEQAGFDESRGEWKCTECGFVNKIDSSELYLSEDEFQLDKNNPYKGLTDKDVLDLSLYREDGYVGGKENIIRVHHCDTGKQYIKKLLSIYDKSVYDYLKANPISHMPKIIEMHESSNCLIVIEEFIEGRTVEDLIETGTISEGQALGITRDVCCILNELHSASTPIIHRDVNPSNIIITPQNEVYLLDINVAKWFDPEETDDTRHMGTQYYAAPEQVGYGLSASSTKSDIYAVGMLLNVMITGCFPKEKRPRGNIWNVIECCISLDAKERYSAKELINELEKLQGVLSAEETNR